MIVNVSGSLQGLLVLPAVTAAVACTAAGASDGGKAQVKLNPADQALARAAVVQRPDLGPGVWRGGRKKLDLPSGPSCPGHHPKQSDLVITGAAASAFTSAALTFDSEAQVLKTARLVRLDWQRSIAPPSFVSCFRTTLAKSIGQHGRVTSFKRIGAPQVATYTARFRAHIALAHALKPSDVIVDFVAVAQGRLEIALTATAPAGAQTPVAAAEMRLARLLLARAHR